MQLLSQTQFFYLFSSGLAGMTMAINRYPIAAGNTAEIISSTINITLITVESILRYSPSPPHTPAIFLSVLDLYSFFALLIIILYH